MQRVTQYSHLFKRCFTGPYYYLDEPGGFLTINILYIFRYG